MRSFVLIQITVFNTDVGLPHSKVPLRKQPEEISKFLSNFILDIPQSTWTMLTLLNKSPVKSKHGFKAVAQSRAVWGCRELWEWSQSKSSSKEVTGSGQARAFHHPARFSSSPSLLLTLPVVSGHLKFSPQLGKAI